MDRAANFFLWLFLQISISRTFQFFHLASELLRSTLIYLKSKKSEWINPSELN